MLQPAAYGFTRFFERIVDCGQKGNRESEQRNIKPVEG
jgi:hypothetical protein